MRLSLKTKQVVGVTLTVGVVVAILSLMNLASLARLRLEQSQARNVMLANFIADRARLVVTSRGERGLQQLQEDVGVLQLLEATTTFEREVGYAAIVDPNNVIVVFRPEPEPEPELDDAPEDLDAADARRQGPTAVPSVSEPSILEPRPRLHEVVQSGVFAQLQAVMSEREYEVQESLVFSDPDEPFAEIRIGVSMPLTWQDLRRQLEPALLTALTALLVVVGVSLVLTNWMLRPIHVLKAGLARLGMGEEGVKLDLPPGDEFGDLGSSFNTLSSELSAVRAKLAGQAPGVESVVDQLEDAVAVVNIRGELVFANSAFRTVVPGLGEAAAGAPLGHDFPYRGLVARVLETGESQGPMAVDLPAAEGHVQQSVAAHPLSEAAGQALGVMIVARNLSYLSHLDTTLNYSRKLAALNRLLAGVAHEVKNPLNAMTIHLELLKQKLRAAAGAEPAARDGGTLMPHVSTIGMEIRRLDEVVQGFLKFSRPEELSLEPVDLPALLDDVGEVMGLQAQAAGVAIVTEYQPGLPRVNGDRAMLRQAFLNLALNACQAMPQGGTLRFTAEPDGARFVVVEVADTGVGIQPEHLEKLFDLYFSTKDKGSGLGLSMVYRTIHLHDGSIEVESVLGTGSTFRLRLPRAEVPAPRRVA